MSRKFVIKVICATCDILLYKYKKVGAGSLIKDLNYGYLKRS